MEEFILQLTSLNKRRIIDRLVPCNWYALEFNYCSGLKRMSIVQLFIHYLAFCQIDLRYTFQKLILPDNLSVAKTMFFSSRCSGVKKKRKKSKREMERNQSTNSSILCGTYRSIRRCFVCRRIFGELNRKRIEFSCSLICNIVFILTCSVWFEIRTRFTHILKNVEQVERGYLYMISKWASPLRERKREKKLCESGASNLKTLKCNDSNHISCYYFER